MSIGQRMIADLALCTCFKSESLVIPCHFVTNTSQLVVGGATSGSNQYGLFLVIADKYLPKINLMIILPPA